MAFSLLPARSSFAILLWLGGAAFSLLAAALVAQYGFGMRPCHLCLWQRGPYAVLVLLAMIAWLTRHAHRALRLAYALALLLLAAEAGMAAYHSAVERHWIAGPSECTGNGVDKNASIDDIRAQIMGATMVRCDEAAWMVPGISMANANLAAALGLLVIAIARRPKPMEA